MKTIGFIKSNKENENRIALLPKNIDKIKNKNYIFVEKGYGIALNISDQEYIDAGCNVVSRDETLRQDIIVDPKIGDSDYLKQLHNKTIFGWIHAVQNRDITDILVNNKLTAFAWEDMYDYGRHIFWRNNEVAGEAAVMHAITCYGIMPYDANVAIIGNGNTSRGAYRVLTQLGAKVKVYNRNTEQLFKSEIGDFDIVVNCVLWDVNRTDHIICESDLSKMKKGALIIDVSCDKKGGIETSIPTTIDNPIYEVDEIYHYVVDHTPSLFYRTVSSEISDAAYKFYDELIEEKYSYCLNESKIVDAGVILDKKIKEYQKR